MTTLSDQFSAVRKAQFEAQFDFFQSIATQALDSAGRVAALNLALSRDTVQRSIGAGFALANSRDPRDVLTLGGQAEEQVRSLFAYGRELLGIAAGVRPYAALPQGLARAPQLAVDTVDVIDRSAAQASAPVQAAAPTVAAAAPAAEAAPLSEPVVVAEPEAAPAPLAAAAEPPAAPVAEPSAIAKAAGKGTARAAAIPHPAAAPVAELATEERKVPAPAVSAKRKK